MNHADPHVALLAQGHPIPVLVGYTQVVAGPAVDSLVVEVAAVVAAVAEAAAVVEAVGYNRVADNSPDWVADSWAAAAVVVVDAVAAVWVDPAADNCYRVGGNCPSFGRSLDFAGGDYANPAVQPEVDST
ncbi:MAG: hypothetical protein F9K46_03145 [Anaerolineae bacterium]|nr:MAG: hypothetical protein F9K46_03145 [Anaerolineae bacterium]